MKPIDIRPSTQFNTDLLKNISITETNPEIQCSIQNVEVAFLELDRLSIVFRTLPCNELPKYIKRDIQRITKYIKAESKLISKELKVQRKSMKRK